MLTYCLTPACLVRLELRDEGSIEFGFISIAGTMQNGSAGRSSEIHMAYITPAEKVHWRNSKP